MHRTGFATKSRRGLWRGARRSAFRHSSIVYDAETKGNTVTSVSLGSQMTNATKPLVSATIPSMGRGILVGQYGTMTRTYTSDDVDCFGGLIQDFNPLHSSEVDVGESECRSKEENSIKALEMESYTILEKAGLIQYNPVDGAQKALVHGMFVSSLFSSIFANLAPGCVYLNQSLDFASPVFVGDTVVGCIHVDSIRDWRRRKGGIVARCNTRVYKLLTSEASVNENHDVDQSPVHAILAIKGNANVWLPIGYPQKGF